VISLNQNQRSDWAEIRTRYFFSLFGISNLGSGHSYGWFSSSL